MTTERIARAQTNGAAAGFIGTMYDGVVYPSGDGEPMAENDYQFEAITYLVWTLKTLFRDDPTVYAAGDMFIYYRRGDIGARLAPDVFVFAGAKGNHRRQSWRTWVEGGVPQFVLEVASPSTWELDAADKRDAYRNMGVLEYWRLDPESGEYFPEILIGERLVNGEYVRLEVRRDADGTLRGYSDFLKLDLCVRPDGRIRLYDPAAGEWLSSHDEAVDERDETASERDEAVRERDETASERDEAVRERDETARERDETARERDEIARARDEAVRERDIANAEIERLRAALRAERGEG